MITEEGADDNSEGEMLICSPTKRGKDNGQEHMSSDIEH